MYTVKYFYFENQSEIENKRNDTWIYLVNDPKRVTYTYISSILIMEY